MASSLTPALARVEAILVAADGAYVASRLLAGALDVPLSDVRPLLSELRRARPKLAIEGRRGRGYRAVAPPTGRAARPPSDVGACLLDLLPSSTAELLKAVALDSGETVQAAAERLIHYGAEVHRDLVLEGCNPLALARQRHAVGSDARH